MKSIGLFWSNKELKEKKCKNCFYSQQHAINQASSTKKESNSFDFQINLWNSRVKNVVTGKVTRFRAIDIGVVCPLSARALVFLFPFKVERNDFHDLVRCLSLDTDLLCTVFNEDLRSSSEPAKSYHKIDGADLHYLMYELSKENIETLEYDEQSNLTQMKIVINSDFRNEDISGCRLFIRFRIKLQSFDAFAKKKEVSNDWLQSAFSSTYMFDVRLNDVRELSKKRKEFVEHQGFQLPEFNKVHFFYMADSEEIVENGSSIKLDKRLLENDRWHSYLGANLEFVSENIAHHWKKKENFEFPLKNDGSKLESVTTKKTIKDFTIFFKTEFSDIRGKRVYGYLCLVVLLGWISSSLVTLISSFIPNCICYERVAWGVETILLVVVTYCLVKYKLCKR